MKSASKVGGDLRAPRDSTPCDAPRTSHVVGSALRADRPRRLVPSGIDWIGDMPEGWNCGKVEYYYGIQLGKMLDPNSSSEHDTLEKYYCAANVHFEGGVDSSDLKEMWFSDAEKTAYRIIPGDLLVVEGGAGAGGSAVLKEDVGPVYMQNSIMRVRPGPTTDNRFLCYWIEYVVKSGYMVLVCNKATIPHFTKEKLGRVMFPIPPLPEQQAIAAKLDAVCGRIDSLTAKIEKEITALEEYRKSLITKCVTKGLNPKAKLKPSGVDWIGDVPTGWKVKRLKYELREPLFYGASESGDDYDNDLPRYIRITDITQDGKLRDDGMLSLSQDVAKPYMLKNRDILLARSGATAGKAFMYFEMYGSAAFAGYLICCRLDETDVDARYVYYTMQGHSYDQWKSSVVIQATIPNISAEKYANYKIAIPPLPEQREIAAYLDKKCAAIDAVLVKRRQQLVGLAEYRKSVIYAYVTGKKEVAAVA